MERSFADKEDMGMYDFLRAALPWGDMGLFVAITAVKWL